VRIDDIPILVDRPPEEVDLPIYHYEDLVDSGDCRKMTYQIAPNFRSSSRRGNGRIVELFNRFRNAEGGRKDKQDGM